MDRQRGDYISLWKSMKHYESIQSLGSGKWMNDSFLEG